jgi:hypothetical protein
MSNLMAKRMFYKSFCPLYMEVGSKMEGLYGTLQATSTTNWLDAISATARARPRRPLNSFLPCREFTSANGFRFAGRVMPVCFNSHSTVQSPFIQASAGIEMLTSVI